MTSTEKYIMKNSQIYNLVYIKVFVDDEKRPDVY